MSCSAPVGTMSDLPVATDRPVATGTGLAIFGCEPDEAELFRELSPLFGITPRVLDAPVSARTASAASGTRCVSVGHTSTVSAAALHALKRAGVEYLSTRSIGLDHIDLAAADDLGITVENVVYAPDGVADFTLMLMLMAIRHATGMVGAAERPGVRPATPRGRELRDLTVGVVGVGNIGRAVVDRLRGFGCRVLGNNGDRPVTVAAEIVPLDDLLHRSDVVTLHVPLTADTRHLIGRERIASMKPGAVLVNTGRGALVDTDALATALELGTLGGAALDVLEGEEERLQRLPNAIVTPHTAYYTEGTLRDTVEKTLANCRTFERTRP